MNPSQLAPTRLIALLGFICIATSSAHGAPSESGRFAWTEYSPGFSVGRYQRAFDSDTVMSDVTLLRIDPVRYSFHVVLSSDLGAAQAHIPAITKRVGGIAGINGSFFDPKGKPLGLLISNSAERQRLQRGGAVLTGIFAVRGSRPSITFRDDFAAQGVTEALQAGPRLIVSGAPVPLRESDSGTRRSGIAITRTDEVIIYATMVRFPGATLHQIQSMLLEQELDIRDALNLDGGGSSQLFVQKLGEGTKEISIAGGDEVPVGLVVKKR